MVIGIAREIQFLRIGFTLGMAEAALHTQRHLEIIHYLLDFFLGDILREYF